MGGEVLDDPDVCDARRERALTAGADLVQVTQLARLEAFPQLLQRGVVALDVADGPDKPLRRERSDETLGVLEGFREGLLDERVHAGLGHL